MNIGIFTYGTRGDLQPYVALALGLKAKGHQVTISATEDFKEFVEGFNISFQPLFGNAEGMMNSAEGQSILKSENPIKLMKYYFKVLHDSREPLRKSYFTAISKVDFIIANAMTLPIVSTIAEKQNKKMAITYFMPPVVPTKEFPLGDFDFFNFSWYNKLTYKIAQGFFWKFVKKDTNEYRKELGLAELKENLISHNNETCWDELDKRSDDYVIPFITANQERVKSLLTLRNNVSIFAFREPGVNFNKIKKWDKSIIIDSDRYLFNMLFKERSTCGNSIIVLPDGRYVVIRSDSHSEAMEYSQGKIIELLTK